MVRFVSAAAILVMLCASNRSGVAEAHPLSKFFKSNKKGSLDPNQKTSLSNNKGSFDPKKMTSLGKKMKKMVTEALRAPARWLHPAALKLPSESPSGTVTNKKKKEKNLAAKRKKQDDSAPVLIRHVPLLEPGPYAAHAVHSQDDDAPVLSSTRLLSGAVPDAPQNKKEDNVLAVHSQTMLTDNVPDAAKKQDDPSFSDDTAHPRDAGISAGDSTQSNKDHSLSGITKYAEDSGSFNGDTADSQDAGVSHGVSRQMSSVGSSRPSDEYTSLSTDYDEYTTQSDSNKDHSLSDNADSQDAGVSHGVSKQMSSVGSSRPSDEDTSVPIDYDDSDSTQSDLSLRGITKDDDDSSMGNTKSNDASDTSELAADTSEPQDSAKPEMDGDKSNNVLPVPPHDSSMGNSKSNDASDTSELAADTSGPQDSAKQEMDGDKSNNVLPVPPPPKGRSMFKGTSNGRRVNKQVTFA